MRYVVGNEDVEALRTAGAPKEYSDSRKPILALLRDLVQRKDCHQISIRKDGMSLTLGKRGPHLFPPP
jgi:hypothetical protein